MNVILIDDHALFRVGLEGLLERRGIHVIASVANGEDGILKSTELDPDVILLDMRMPNLNGITVLKRMRDSGITTPVVVLTTSNEERDLIDSRGAHGCLMPGQIGVAAGIRLGLGEGDFKSGLRHFQVGQFLHDRGGQRFGRARTF